MSSEDRGIVDAAKEETLLTMYKSVDRMNRHMLEHSPGKDLGDSIISEQHLQINLRGNFEELQEPTEALD